MQGNERSSIHDDERGGRSFVDLCVCTRYIAFVHPQKVQQGVLPPPNSWIISIIWTCIALDRTPYIDCYRGGGGGSTQGLGCDKL